MRNGNCCYKIGFIDMIILKFNGKYNTVVSSINAHAERTNRILQQLEIIEHGEHCETTESVDLGGLH